ncbi:hypothetical protein BH18ACT3_BH18ACT3_07790 [soil metagenome]
MTGADAQFLTDRFLLDEITASLRSFGLSLVADVPGGRDRSPPRRRSPHSVSEPEAVHRTWLDTFDWRLHGANAELQQIDIDGRATLELRSSGGRAVRADGREIADLAWPAIAETLPGGPLQDCVAQLAGIRALQVTARATVRRWTFRAVNGDDKTVARVLVEDEVSLRGDDDGVSVRIYVEPLRGYERPARRIGTVLGSLPGVDAAPTSCYERILTAPTTGVRRPDAWGGGTDLHLTPSLPAASAVRAMLCSFREAVLINRPGVLEDVDTEFLHDLRVAVRRARSILKLTGDVLTETRVRELATELKWLGDVTTPTRDLDVYLAEIPAMTKRLRAAAPTDLNAFGEHLRKRRGETLDQLRADLTSERFACLLHDWEAVVAEPDEPDPPETDSVDWDSDSEPVLRNGLTATALADERLTRAHRRVLKMGAAITPASAPDRLHTLRKRCKELRYLVEVFEPLEMPGARKRALPVLKNLQDCLGEFQDSEVQAAAIRSYAAEMMSSASAAPGPLLAMGELAAQLDADQRRSRDRFAGIFATFQNATAKLRWTRGVRQ